MKKIIENILCYCRKTLSATPGVVDSVTGTPGVALRAPTPGEVITDRTQVDAGDVDSINIGVYDADSGEFQHFVTKADVSQGWIEQYSMTPDGRLEFDAERSEFRRVIKRGRFILRRVHQLAL